MKDYLISFNLVDNDLKILNNTSAPIVFYWNGEGTLTDIICNDPKFMNFISAKCFNIERYSSKIVGSKIRANDDSNDECEEFSIYVQDIFNLESLDDDHRSFYYDYLIKHFMKLYESAFKTKFMGIEDKELAIKEMYKELQVKYPNKIIKETVINYIRSEIQNSDNLTMFNTNWIIQRLKDILKNEE